MKSKYIKLTDPGELFHVVQLPILLLFQESKDGVRRRLPEPASAAATAAGHNEHVGADGEAGKKIFQVDTLDS